MASVLEGAVREERCWVDVGGPICQASAMSQLKNVLLMMLGAGLVVETWYLVRESAADRTEVAALRRQNDDWRGQYREMKRQRDDAEKRTGLANSSSPTSIASSAGSGSTPADSLEQHMNEVLKRARLIKGWFDKHPDQKVGEFAYLKDDDWLHQAEGLKSLASEEDFRKAAAGIRERAEEQFMNGPLSAAMKAYLKTSNNMLPTDISMLAANLDASVDPGLLQHYTMIASGPELTGMPLFAINPATIVVDEKYDTTMIAAGPGGMWSRGGSNLAMTFDTMQATNAYRIANGGQQAPNQQFIVPYFKNPQYGAQFLAELQKR